ncbi:Aerobic respiration control sensor protein ArcB [Thiorhodovibrio winogradskyi]|uniref:histidine kinase n=1 Tax=Thiorhodovibrio winogradskyi TaxID=77007 RepID=A0ABZ0S8N4_9GAMM|nr:CheR family methyltransferase [Thiorhodovibrio winogradskyi]
MGDTIEQRDPDGGFFRDRQAWLALEEHVVPSLLSQLIKDQHPVRVWVPGCGSGEEAYSLAILLTDAAKAAGCPCKLRIFATDVVEESLARARAGVYPRHRLNHLSPERVGRHFQRSGEHFRVKQRLREKVIVAPHDLLFDPPFYHLALISCRGVLSILNKDNHQRIFAGFHFALRPRGYLFLGRTECLGESQILFAPIVNSLGLYQRQEHAENTARSWRRALADAARPPRRKGPESSSVRPDDNNGYGGVAERALLGHATPPSVLIDRSFKVLHRHGELDGFLSQPAVSDATEDLLTLAVPALRAPLRVLLHRALARREPVYRAGIGIPVTSRDTYQLSLAVVPVENPRESDDLLLVSFHAITGHDWCHVTCAADAEALQQPWLAGNFPTATEEALESSREEMDSLTQELVSVNIQLENKVQQLEELNDDLGNLLVSTDIATLFLDRSLCIRRYTPAAAALISLVAEDQGRLLTAMHWPFRDDALPRDLKRALKGQALEVREIQSEAGRWFLRRVRPYRADDETVQGVVVTFMDITSRKRTEVALRDSEEHLRRITNALPVLISYVDRAGRYRFNNARYRDWFGVDPGAAQGNRVCDVIGENAFAEVQPLMQRALSGETAHFEGWLEYASGGQRCVSAEYIPDTDSQGFTRGFFALVTDITVRRKAEEGLERLRQDNQRHLDELQALLDAAPIGIFFARDPACQDMIMNQAGAALLRGPPDANPSKSGPGAEELAFRVFHSERELRPEELPMQQAAALGRVIGGMELHIRFPDGAEVNLLTHAAPLYDDNRQVRGSVGTFVDVSEQKRLEARLRRQTRDLETINHRKDAFLAMLGHELRNPLTPLRTAVYLLSTNPTPGVDLAWIGEMIDRQVAHLERMVDDLLDVARVRRGTLSLTCEEHPLQGVLQECVEAITLACSEKDLALTCVMPEEPLKVFGDRIRLVQVFSNLLNNAVRYTPDHGQINLTLGLTDDGQVCAEVSDSGKGISSDLLPHVFDIFDSAVSHPDRAHAGLGLGLTLVKQIVGLHDGQVEASSPGLDQGSRFRVTLPLASRTKARDDSAAVFHQGATSSGIACDKGELTLDVLVVDDNLDILSSVAGLLRQLGHRVRVMDGGSRVLDMVRDNPVDLVLLDIGLPDLDGYQVARLLAQEPKRAEFSVVAITGYVDADLAAAAGTSDFDAWLQKPFRLEQLKPHLRKCAPSAHETD